MLIPQTAVVFLYALILEFLAYWIFAKSLKLVCSLKLWNHVYMFIIGTKECILIEFTSDVIV